MADYHAMLKPLKKLCTEPGRQRKTTIDVDGGTDLDIHKSRMNGLSCGEEIMTIYSAVLIQYQRVTDGRTDGQTDVQPISITCFSIADARKNK